MPDNAERLAIALSDGERPSHVIMSRNGAFITCLAPGMKLGDIPVMTQHQFTGLTKQEEKSKQRGREISELMSNNKVTTLFDQDMYKVGRNLTRENFKKWEILQPLMLSHLIKQQATTTINASHFLRRFLGIGRRGKVRSKKERDFLRVFWQTKWSSGHTTLLLFSDLTFVKKILKEELNELDFAPLLMREKIVPMTLIGIWYVAQMGQYLFALIKKTLITQESLWDYADAVIMIIAIALRHSRYKTEAIKLLNRKITRLPADQIEVCEKVKKTFLPCLTGLEEHHELLEKFALEHFDKEQKIHSGRPIINEIPTEMKILFLARHERQFIEDTPWLEAMALFMPWIIKLKPEEFYIPEKYTELFYPYSQKHTMTLIPGNMFKPESPRVLKDNEKPSRNQPCHCGSGKKYKRCCFKKDNLNSKAVS